MDLNEAYHILGIRPGATKADAKTAYKDQVRLWHPDRYSEGSSLRALAETNMRRVNLAYETVMPDLIQEDTPRPKPQKVARPSPKADPATDSNPVNRHRITLADRILGHVNPLLERLNFDRLIDWIRKNRPPHRPPWYRYHGSDTESSENNPQAFSFESILNDAICRVPEKLQRSPLRRKNHPPQRTSKALSDRIEPVEPVGRLEGVKKSRSQE